MTPADNFNRVLAASREPGWVVEIGGRRVPLTGPPVQRHNSITLQLDGEEVQLGTAMTDRIGYDAAAWRLRAAQLPPVFRPDGSAWEWSFPALAAHETEVRL